MELNKHILLVMKWIDDPKSVSRDELIENRRSAVAYITCTAAAADAAADDAAANAEYWVNKYFERTGENKQDYSDAIEAGKKPQEPESKEWNGEGLPLIGALCKATGRWNDFERQVNLKDGQKVKILMDYKCPKTGTDGVIFTWIEGADNIRTEWTGNEKHFRPLKTQEQKDREAFIEKGFISYLASDLEKCIDGKELDKLFTTMFNRGFKAPEGE